MKYLPALIVLLFSITAAADSAMSYYAPPGQFNASIQVMSLGLANIIGLFGNATGSFSFDEQAKNLSNLRLAIDATSVVSNSSDNKNDLSNLLGVSQYPEIRFTALDAVTFADDKVSIKGTLTIHGTSKPVTMDAVINHANKGTPGAADSLGLSIRGSFKRADFGMGDDPEVPGRFGDTIALQLEMQALKQ